MGTALFYHLTQTPLEATLPSLLTKARGKGWRVAVRGSDAARLDWLDQRLWMGDGFLPHGVAGGPFDADQPVLLTLDRAAANDPQCVMAIDGAQVDPGEVAGLERMCILFDGNDPAAMDVARAQWKAMTTAGCAAQYWSQDGGAWAMKTESAGR